MWSTRPIFVGAHFWFAPEGAAFTSPAADTIAQNGVWPDGDEPNWDSWYLGTVESFEVDPKPGPKEQILTPSPGVVKATAVVSPFAIPEIKVTLLQTPVLVAQLALNAANIWGTNSTLLVPNSNGNGYGVNGILKVQKYDQKNALLANYITWAFMELQGAWKGAPKTMTKPEFMATVLDSVNNDGATG